MRTRIFFSAALLLACKDSDPDTTPADPDAGDAGVTMVSLDGSMDASGSGDAGDAATGALQWSACGEQGYQCALLQVPRDHDRPASGTVELALARLPARGSRLGSLVWNPGGPGASAIDFLPVLADYVGDQVLERFDLVAFDPRGVGASTPLDCHARLQALHAVDPSPDDDAEWAALDAASAAFAADCASKHGALLPHLSTIDVARDLDDVRSALGDEKLRYLGFSYGAGLGAWYADLFATRVQALVLDGPRDLALSPVDGALAQAKGFEQALQSYFAWCNEQPARCSWTKGQAPASAFAALSARVEQSPIPAPGLDRAAGPGEFIGGVIFTLYGGEDGWELLSDTLLAAVNGDGGELVLNLDAYLERDFDSGEYTNITEVNFAVNCLDRPPITLAEMRAAEGRFRSEAPTFGLAVLTGDLVCAHWPVRGGAQQVPMGRSAPVLVIGTTGDPATPYSGAQAMASRLGARLFTYEGEGHTAYSRGIPCVDSVVERFFIEGMLPEQGASCRDAPVLPRVSPKTARVQRTRRWR
jgi:pimeloyl-ACP methyl ester carboxylesterase